jgi:hypothetical protein
MSAAVSWSSVETSEPPSGEPITAFQSNAMRGATM